MSVKITAIRLVSTQEVGFDLKDSSMSTSECSRRGKRKEISNLQQISGLPHEPFEEHALNPVESHRIFTNANYV
jgi:hypothetical protein